MSLPAVGQFSWGTPLNSYIVNVVLATANSAGAAIANHQTASDPHGDRAYALGLVQPLTNGVNGPNGFLQLNNIGKIPSGVLPPGGGRTSAFDVVKDYSAPVNGTDASTAIQNALNDCGTAGGGEVWVGDGTFGIGETLYVPNNVWLHLSPGATMNRILGGGGQAPVYMVANFNGAVSGSGATNILIQGGSWIFDGQTATGSPMAFVNGTDIVVRDTSIRTLQQCPAILFAGCTDCGDENVLYSTATPTGARSAYASSPPAVRIETAASSVISGLNSSMYTNNPCTNIWTLGCAITGATASDGTGLFTAFGGLVGTTAAVSSSYHTSILVMGNSAVALPDNGCYAVNWQTMHVMGNDFNLNNGQSALISWSPSAPATTNQIVANNSTADATIGNLRAYYTTASGGRTGTTLTIDGTLQVTVVANAVYEVRASIGYQCGSGSAGIKYDFSGPSGFAFNYTTSRMVAESQSTGFSNITYYFTQTSAIAAGSPDNAITSNGNAGIQVLGLLQVGSTGGTFGFEWCQEVNQGGYNLTLDEGSYLYLTRVA